MNSLLAHIARHRVGDVKIIRETTSIDADIVEVPIKTSESEWEHVTEEGVNLLSKDFSFEDTKLFLFFLMEVYKFAESLNHYPDVNISERLVTIKLYTRYLNDITDTDIKMSQKILDLYKDMSYLGDQ